MPCRQTDNSGIGCKLKRRRRVIRFLRPCLLVLLHQSSAHGYSLNKDLSVFGFDLDQLDPSLVYRVLREMESEGLIASTWDQESFGPQRRVYNITADGEQHLNGWVEDLKQTRREIDTLLAAHQTIARDPQN